jgi:hypothetical protein
MTNYTLEEFKEWLKDHPDQEAYANSW